jgi:3-oxoisoapionate decarboxylase
MKLGISSWSVPWSVGVWGYPQPACKLDALSLVRKAAEHRVQVVQIADNLPLHELSVGALDQVGKEAQTSGLTVEVGTRGLERDRLVRYIGIAQRVGARSLRTVVTGSLLGEDQVRSAESLLRNVAPELERAGVTLALENNEAFSAEEFARIVDGVRSPSIGICIDTANSLGRPEVLETVLEQLAKHAVMVHVKDYDIQRIDTRMGFSVVGRPVGGGRVDVDRVLQRLHECRREDVSVIIEHWPPFVSTIEETVRLEEEWLATSVEFLRPKLSANGRRAPLP